MPLLNSAIGADVAVSIPASNIALSIKKLDGLTIQNQLLGIVIAIREVDYRLDCDLYLIQDTRGDTKIEPGQDWKLIWQGKRASERRESFRLFQHI